MANLSGNIGFWPSKIVAVSIFHHDYSVVVHVISGIFLALSIMFMMPIAFFILFDILIWLWRMLSFRRDIPPQLSEDAMIEPNLSLPRRASLTLNGSLRRRQPGNPDH